jgi:hypothetical protein
MLRARPLLSNTGGRVSGIPLPPPPPWCRRPPPPPPPPPGRWPRPRIRFMFILSPLRLLFASAGGNRRCAQFNLRASRGMPLSARLQSIGIGSGGLPVRRPLPTAVDISRFGQDALGTPHCGCPCRQQARPAARPCQTLFYGTAPRNSIARSISARSLRISTTMPARRANSPTGPAWPCPSSSTAMPFGRRRRGISGSRSR